MASIADPHVIAQIWYDTSMLPEWEARLNRLNPDSYEAEALAERIAQERLKFGLPPFVRTPLPPPPTRSRLTDSGLRAAVWDKTDGRCWYCDKQTNPWRDFHIDHVIPRSQGGTDDLDNLVPACRACNLAKGPRRGKSKRHAR